MITTDHIVCELKFGVIQWGKLSDQCIDEHLEVGFVEVLEV